MSAHGVICNHYLCFTIKIFEEREKNVHIPKVFAVSLMGCFWFSSLMMASLICTNISALTKKKKTVSMLQIFCLLNVLKIITESRSTGLEIVCSSIQLLLSI